MTKLSTNFNGKTTFQKKNKNNQQKTQVPRGNYEKEPVVVVESKVDLPFFGNNKISKLKKYEQLLVKKAQCTFCIMNQRLNIVCKPSVLKKSVKKLKTKSK